MKTIFDKNTNEELIHRINSLCDACRPNWGKMTVYQMVKHCIKWEKMLLREKYYRQSVLGRMVGRFALKDIMKEEPSKRNLPTISSFKEKGNGDLAAAKQEWMALVNRHILPDAAEGFVHPFFGPLTADQAGKMAYKHFDHHLRQFNQ